MLTFTGIANGEDTLHCQTSGDWQIDGNTPVLSAVLCHQQEKSGFYRFDFTNQTFAFAPDLIQGSHVQYLGGFENILFYSTDTQIYALERAQLAIIWHRSWQNVEILPEDPHAPTTRAFLSKENNAHTLHIINIAKTDIRETLAYHFPNSVLTIQYNASNITVLTPTTLYVFARPNASNDGNVDNARHPGENWPQPQIIPLEKEMTRDTARLDSHGLMTWDKSAKKLSYYRYQQKSWTRAAINATASIHSLAQNDDLAMAITVDASTVRIVARLGAFLQNRYEAKYWKLPAEGPALVADSALIALDGGSDNRVQIIDTSEMTWKRVQLISYPAPGRPVDLFHNRLITLHPESLTPVILWNAKTGEKIAAISQESLNKSGLTNIEYAKTIREMPQFILLKNDAQRFAIFNRLTSQLSITATAENSAYRQYPKNLQFFANNIVIGTAEAPNQWRLYSTENTERLYKTDQLLAGPIKQLQSPKKKWYGYCITDNDCFRTPILPLAQTQNIPTTTKRESTSHQPSILSWAIAILAFLSMIGIMAWRCGCCKRAHLASNSSSDRSLYPTTEFFDSKHRRVICDRDVQSFLSPTLFAKPFTRLTLSIVIGVCVGICITLPYAEDDTSMTFVLWTAFLALPICTLLWTSLSWSYWNRFYLLRFGIFAEGIWLHQAQPEQSIAYLAQNEKTYELSRHQWQRVKFVPIILYDPQNPNFAIQYTGNCTHSLTSNLPEKTAKTFPVKAFDIKKFAAVFAIILTAVICSQILFNLAYPNPLSARTLNSIEREITNTKDSVPFTVKCLSFCKTKACEIQCHQRQLLNIFKNSDSELNHEIVETPQDLFKNLNKNIDMVCNILEDPSMQCDEKAYKLQSISLWTPKFFDVFSNVYSNPEAFRTSGIGDIAHQLDAHRNYLKALCDESGICMANSKTCPQPPSCDGDIQTLKSAICAFQAAILLKNIPPQK